MSEPPDPKDDSQPEAEVVSIEDARKRAEEKQTSEAAPPSPGTAGADPAANNPLQPIMAAIARELAGLAGPDGTVKIDGNNPDAEAQAKTQALLRGIGQGLGEVLAQALSKWAGGKVNLNFTTAPNDEKPAIPSTPIRSAEPPSAPPGADDPTKKS
jgi:hypothetical protein